MSGSRCAGRGARKVPPPPAPAARKLLGPAVARHVSQPVHVDHGCTRASRDTC